MNVMKDPERQNDVKGDVREMGQGIGRGVGRGGHVPVLTERVLAELAPEPGGVFVDCTAGLGGHAIVLAEHVKPGGMIVLNDLDEENLHESERLLRNEAEGVEVVGVHGSFAALPRTLRERGIRADMVLADLGFCSNQVAEAARGLSFRNDGPLDMRLNRSVGMTAADLIAEAPEEELARILYEYGEERQSRRIARKLVQARQESPIQTTGELAQLVRSVSFGRTRIDPATRTFQALRIAVNDELGHLEGLMAEIRRGAQAVVQGSTGWLAAGARVGIISFHSLEDRPVKQCFSKLVQEGLARSCSRKPIVAEETELSANPRARSAKLRVLHVNESGGEGGVA